MVESIDGDLIDIHTMQKKIEKQYEEYSKNGYRTLGIAYRELEENKALTKEDENSMIFLGFIVLFDPPKEGIIHTILRLNDLGIHLKIVTGDNMLVAKSLSEQIGIDSPNILTGIKIRQMSDEALIRQVRRIDVFAEVEPNQKERIIRSLQKAGMVVGFIGDGINDAPALHAADVGISVDSAVDVAKEAADIVLLEQGLEVLEDGIREGRRTFANTLKYVFMATSANFGNMFSMAGASLFLPFLPLLPKQILLTNFMTDFPEMTIATDNVDSELIQKPRRWNIKFIRNFMLVFGTLSSVFDYLTFGVLLLILHGSTAEFRTGWFVESVVSATLVVLVIRTHRTIFKSFPGKHLLIATVLIVLVTLVLPYTPVAYVFGFTTLPIKFIFMMAIIVILYIISAEVAKKVFFRRYRKHA